MRFSPVYRLLTRGKKFGKKWASIFDRLDTLYQKNLKLKLVQFEKLKFKNPGYEVSGCIW